MVKILPGVSTNLQGLTFERLCFPAPDAAVAHRSWLVLCLHFAEEEPMNIDVQPFTEVGRSNGVTLTLSSRAYGRTRHF